MSFTHLIRFCSELDRDCSTEKYLLIVDAILLFAVPILEIVELSERYGKRRGDILSEQCEIMCDGNLVG